MERVLQIQRLLLRSRRLPWVVAGIALLVLAGAVALVTAQSRQRVRAQIVARDGDVLHAVTQMKHDREAEELGLGLDDPASQLDLIIETSRLRGVIGARLFDTEGRFVEAFPGYVWERNLDRADLPVLEQLQPVSHFRPAVKSVEIFLPESTNAAALTETFPVLEVNVPLHQPDGKKLLGIAQFLIEGTSVVGQFEAMERNLARQAVVAFLALAVILAVAVAWSFRRLNTAHRLLAERTAHLVQANQELALAAKTSAVGAVTSHLIHGLKNPLAGLQSFVTSLGSSAASNPDGDLRHAIAAASRMQTMINEVLGVLREEEGAGQYEISLPELVELVSSRVQPLCRERGVTLKTALDAEAVLPNRAANLVALILANLAQNAVEATPRNGTVTLTIATNGETIGCAVLDEGPGFPAGRGVFAPCQSAKEGGSGIGLAISKQLAHHLGAGLELQSNTPRGCVFVLTLPAALWKPKTSSVTVTLG